MCSFFEKDKLPQPHRILVYFVRSKPFSDLKLVEISRRPSPPRLFENPFFIENSFFENFQNYRWELAKASSVGKFKLKSLHREIFDKLNMWRLFVFYDVIYDDLKSFQNRILQWERAIWIVKVLGDNSTNLKSHYGFEPKKI